MTDTTASAPALPEPTTLSRGDEDGPLQLGYTADQMRSYAAAAVRAALASQPVARTREDDRRRFTDPAFNRWLDEGISDAGHTVWDAVGDVQAAWQGWVAREFYAAPSQPVASLPPVWGMSHDEGAASNSAQPVAPNSSATEGGARW